MLAIRKGLTAHESKAAALGVGGVGGGGTLPPTPAPEEGVLIDVSDGKAVVEGKLIDLSSDSGKSVNGGVKAAM